VSEEMVLHEWLIYGAVEPESGCITWSQADLPCHCHCHWEIAFPRLISNLLHGDSGGCEFVKATVVR